MKLATWDSRPHTIDCHEGALLLLPSVRHRILPKERHSLILVDMAWGFPPLPTSLVIEVGDTYDLGIYVLYQKAVRFLVEL